MQPSPALVIGPPSPMRCTRPQLTAGVCAGATESTLEIDEVHSTAEPRAGELTWPPSPRNVRAHS